MKSTTKFRGGKVKRIAKKTNRPRPKESDDEEENQDIEDMLLQQELEGQGIDQNEESSKKKKSKETLIQQTPEEKRLRLAKSILQSVKAPRNIQGDDFFAPAENQPEEAHEQITNILKQEYLKKHNMLYSPYGQRFSGLSFGEPVVYKGHTQCITAVEVCPQSTQTFYSCSKDGSLIKWNRETGKKTFLTMGKDPKQRHQMLCMSINANGSILATGSSDSTIQLWDTERQVLITTLKSHKGDVNGLKFGLNSNSVLCSVSSDRTLKVWDAIERAYIDTFYGHREEGLDIDCINGSDFITSGRDQQVVVWKTEKQTQTIYNGHDYAIDRVRVINSEHFVTASQDGSVQLWATKKKKAIAKVAQAHGNNWIVSLGAIVNTDVFATGSYNGNLNIYQIAPDLKSFKMMVELPCPGIITDIKFQNNFLFAAQSDEHRLGRWITTKCKNQITVIPFKI